MFLSFSSFYSLVFLASAQVYAIPPGACFANFRWDDCGKPPTPVMYYWKPGSRCEVGIWRGCLPNINMFADEYECVATCIFTARAAPGDYHLPNDIYDVTTEDVLTEITDVGNDTAVTTGDVTGDFNTTVTGDTDSTNILATTVGAANTNSDSGAETNGGSVSSPGGTVETEAAS